MRLLFGMILGAVLTVAAAYVHDTMYVTPSPTVPGSTQTIVNWDVARDVAGRATRGIRAEFERLMGR